MYNIYKKIILIMSHIKNKCRERGLRTMRQLIAIN